MDVLLCLESTVIDHSGLRLRPSMRQNFGGSFAGPLLMHSGDCPGQSVPFLLKIADVHASVFPMLLICVFR